MKNSLSILALISVLFAPLIQAAPLSVTVQVDVPTIKCAGCSWAISEELKKLDGVSAVHVDPKKKTAVLEVTSKEVPGKDLITASIESAGYKATGYQVLDTSFSEATKE
ncbi:MAG: heavy-metal-associated domain-containing protein [Verrucomicrobiales bacterium]|nr:heavy-metal-associated domain-containing protein [Verrucomicrobiales bacterium]